MKVNNTNRIVITRSSHNPCHSIQALCTPPPYMSRGHLIATSHTVKRGEVI